jgi:hypothetical protein
MSHLTRFIQSAIASDVSFSDNQNEELYTRAKKSMAGKGNSHRQRRLMNTVIHMVQYRLCRRFSDLGAALEDGKISEKSSINNGATSKGYS